MSPAPAIGSPAPGFTLPSDGGRTISLKNLRGSKVVLYFYPKDDTSGCTKEALSFTDLIGAFEDAGTVVVGLSKDSPSRHDKFKAKHGLKVRLASDEGGSILETYGVWIEKSMYGRKYMGIERATFLIDGQGVIRQIWRKVKVTGHAEAVLEVAQSA